ncbi:DUF4271 domain-containing protein [Cellulophaga tyrosinoxydans]|uniref:DUF4271 domain-containing protein n=1 Tax=Cellulophaga tyrosinoxydans TaxID=504486 RepID=A0A1W1Z6S2_9FLAO|nr:DUF4271 domain-containing protein [Cellulophaga tyrosinoxydans]SMC44130.1 protein of unknown function [Cellulophaga tyrosinoxydans]
MKEVFYRAAQNIDWITIILCCSIISIVLAKSLYYHRFSNFMILPFNNKYIFMYNKKDKLSHWFTIFLSIFQLLNFALFVYYIDSIFHISNATKSANLYFGILGMVLLFFMIKIILNLSNAFVFNITDTISEFLFKNIAYLNYSGFVLLFANILLTYVIKDSKTVVYISFALFFIINMIGWVVVIRNYQKLIANNFFYFILYLCALEITPIVLLGDYFKD